MQHSYLQPLNNQTTQIPYEFVPESSSHLMSSTKKTIAITAMNANTASGGGFLQFQIPTGPGTGWLVPGSLGFSFDFDATTSGATDAVHFAGTGGTGTCGGASVIINRMTLSIGSQQIEQINNYAQFYQCLITHATSFSYTNYDLDIMEGSTTTMTAVSNHATGSFMVPICSGLLNGVKAIPLFLIKSNLNILIDLNPAATAVYNAAGSGATVSSYTVSAPQLFFEVVNTDVAYEATLQAGLNSGKMLSLYFNSVLGTSKNISASPETIISGVSLKSLNGIMACQQLTSALVTTDAGTKYFPKNGNTNTTVRIDGVQVFQPNLTSDPIRYYALQQMIGNYQDSNVNSTVDRTTYPTQGYVLGWNYRRSKSADFTYDGIPANQTLLEWTGVSAAAVLYVYHLYSAEVLIDANGNVMLSK